LKKNTAAARRRGDLVAMHNTPLDDLATRTLDCAFSVHRALGPGLFESVYQACFQHELTKGGIAVRCGVALPLEYDGVRLDCGFQMDMVIEGSIIIENKAIESIHPVHMAQLLTYLRLTDTRIGYLINWNVPLLKHGIKRIVNRL
jgi:GxxExxY protein